MNLHMKFITLNKYFKEPSGFVRKNLKMRAFELHVGMVLKNI